MPYCQTWSVAIDKSLSMFFSLICMLKLGYSVKTGLILSLVAIFLKDQNNLKIAGIGPDKNFFA